MQSIVIAYAIAVALVGLGVWYAISRLRRRKRLRAVLVGTVTLFAAYVINAYQQYPLAVLRATVANRAILLLDDVRTVTVDYRIRANGEMYVFNTTVKCTFRRRVLGESFMGEPPSVHVWENFDTAVGGRLEGRIDEGITAYASIDHEACRRFQQLAEGDALAAEGTLSTDYRSETWPIYIADERSAPATLLTFHLSDQPITMAGYTVWPPTVVSVADNGRISERELMQDIPVGRVETIPARVWALQRPPYGEPGTVGLEINPRCWLGSNTRCSGLALAYVGADPASQNDLFDSGLAGESPSCAVLTDRLLALPPSQFIGLAAVEDDPLLALAASDDFLSIDRSPPTIDGPQLDLAEPEMDIWQLPSRVVVAEELTRRGAGATPLLADYLIHPFQRPAQSGSSSLWDRTYGADDTLHVVQIGQEQPYGCSVFLFTRDGANGLTHWMPWPPNYPGSPWQHNGLCYGSRGFVAAMAGEATFLTTSFDREGPIYEVSASSWTGERWTAPCTVRLEYGVGAVGLAPVETAGE